MPTQDTGELLQRWREFLAGSARRYRKLRDGYYVYASQLINQNLPVLFDFRHLTVVLEIDPLLLHQMMFSTRSMYRWFEIPKRAGGLRRIDVPKPSLMAVQRWILREVLSKQPLHEACIGFVPGRSVKDHVLPHVQSLFALKMDLKDFFPSIQRTRVMRYFELLGYAPNMAFFLSKIVTLDDRLPQGAPTSPMIANLLASTLDHRLAALASALGLRYSRYADDLVFSGDEPLGRSHASFVEAIARDEGFWINDKKTRWFGPDETRRFVGLAVRQGRIRVPRAFRRKVIQQIHYIDRFGLEGHIEHFELPDPIAGERLLGQLAYWEFVEPDNKQIEELRGRLQSAMEKIV
jgi:RNA-directed DNA polymerase